MAQDSAWRWSLALLAAAGLCGATLPVLLAWSQLPEPIAVHWSIELRPDGAMPKSLMLAINTALVLGGLALTLIGARHANTRGRAIRLALMTFLAVTASALAQTIVGRNLGKTSWREAESLTGAMLATQLLLPIAAALVVYVVASRLSVKRSAPITERTISPLAPGAPVFWTGTASNHWLLVIGGLFLLQPVVVRALLPRFDAFPVLLVVSVLVLVVLEAFSFLRVTIDARGVTVTYGRLGFRTRVLPLAEINAARAMRLDPLEHGGWGYRGSLRWLGKAAIVVRSGPAIELALRSGKRLFVTVDDATTAAALVNGLLARAGRAPR